jgi:hypothetical protein
MSNPCVGLVVPTPPVLPTGFSIPLPPLPPDPNLSLCCQIRPEDYIALPPPPWPPFLTLFPNAAALVAINTAMRAAQQVIQGYLDQTVPECPKVPRSKRTSS